ncbi:hypothetical protein MMC28_010977 [Mycoblastus sanguinarius]|nr:hypothetical protein [Mycoblastus sanguinarius]
MNAVNAMSKLALGTFDERIQPVIYSLDNYSDVKILIQDNPEKGTLKTSYVVWGIHSAILTMVTSNQFKTAIFYLKWNGDTVGWLVLGQSNVQLNIVGGNNTQSLIQRSEVSSLLNFTQKNITDISVYTNDTGVSADPRMKVFIEYNGQDVPIYGLFLTVLSGLEYAVQFPSTAQVHPFAVWSETTMSNTLAEFRNHETSRTTPPFLEYRWIIQSLAGLPAYMLRKRRFAETLWVMEVDGVPVGDGYIKKFR